jgi:WD40 repeat protein
VELDVLSAESSSPVAALAFTSDGSELLAVHGIEEVMRRWQIEGGVLLSEMEVGPFGMAAASFDAQARLLATGAGWVEPAVGVGYAVDVSGTRVWDTQSGELILDTAEYLAWATDVSLSSDGRWLVEAYRAGIDILDTCTGEYVMLSTITSPWKEGHGSPSITAATLDPSGAWLAYADDVSRVIIEEWNTENRGSRWTVQSEGAIETPLALMIDPSRQRMAAVTTGHLIIWDLQARFSREVLKKPLRSSPAAGLAFSPDGNLLAVGTKNGWQIWSVGEKKKTIEGAGGAFAVTFSPDGRLFAWGDTEGVIHLWGVLER